MGKRKSNQPHTTLSEDDNSVSSDPLLRLIQQNQPRIRNPIAPLLPQPLKLLEDRREWHPDKQNRAAAAVPTSARTLRVDNSRPAPTAKTPRAVLPQTLRFESPKGVAVCVRRKVRREVIFAQRSAGKGARARNRRRNPWSDIKC